MQDIPRRLNSWKWNELEDEALDRLHCARHEKLYLRGLRKFMDYETGIVGLKRTVCEQGMYELLEELRDRGSRVPEFKPSRHVIQRMLKKLESVGLIQRLPKAHKKDRMVFYLPLACTGKISPEEERTRSAQRGAHNKKVDKPKGCGYSAAQGTHKEERTTSGISGTLTGNTNKYIYRAVDNFSLMYREWFPDQSSLDYLCCEYGFSEDFLSLKVAEFRLYWLERGEPRADWSGQFVRHVEFRLSRRSPEFVLAAKKLS